MKVAPLPIEARLAEDAWIAQAVVCGEGERFLSALIALRRPTVEAWQSEHALAVSFDDALRHLPQVPVPQQRRLRTSSKSICARRC